MEKTFVTKPLSVTGFKASKWPLTSSAPCLEYIEVPVLRVMFKIKKDEKQLYNHGDSQV